MIKRETTIPWCTIYVNGFESVLNVFLGYVIGDYLPALWFKPIVLKLKETYRFGEKHFVFVREIKDLSSFFLRDRLHSFREFLVFVIMFRLPNVVILHVPT